MAAQTLLLAFELTHANRRKIDRRLAAIRPVVTNPTDTQPTTDRSDPSASGIPQAT
ncbi:hypothetical protein KUM39_01000 [Streptomyces sp. J2-1]|uniref:hypothetical protein n=1 Tax=Streptomyces corallincola TaxID=2851888 RepID=UPI001C382994|nr:hypothetical protein [Streptomyces corallincola]MBV2352947.1 hypothetical protein [Streptomyces corallincola]